MLKMVDGTGIIGVDMVCPLGGAVSPPQPPNYDKVEMEGVGSLVLANSLKAPLERLELIGNSVQGENPAPDNPQEIKSTGKWNKEKQKYEIDVKVTGKNLFDQSKLISGFINMTTGAFEESANTSFANSLILDKPILLKSGQTLVTSVDNKYAQNFLRYRTYRKDGTFLINNEPISFSYKATEDLYVIALFYNGMSEEDKKSLQIEISDEPTTYEPYTEQSVQIALNEPLRGIGDYKDTITKDGVVRKIAPYEVNLNDLRDGGYEKTNTVMFSVKVQNKTVGYASSKPSILCNILPDCALQMSNVYNNDKECIAVGNMYVLFRVNKSRLKDTSSFEATKQSFIELMEGKKMLVEYALETSVTELLPESVQAQLSALHSYNGTTHITVDSGEVPCGIKLTYRKEK